MHRVDSATAEENTHGTGKDGFTDGDPGMAIPPTDLTEDWFNAVQEEICNFVEGCDADLIKADNRQLLKAFRLFFALNWTEQANPKNFNLNGIAALSTPNFGGTNPNFVAVGGADGSDAYIVTSTDGMGTWTERTNAKNFDLHAVAHNGSNLFVAVGAADGSDAYIVTSPDGVTWTEQANPKNFDLNGVAYGDGLFVAVGANDGTDSYIVTSPDGVTWTERSIGITDSLNGVSYGEGVFVVVGTGDIWSSADGSTWTNRTPAALSISAVLTSVYYANGIFIATRNPVVSDFGYVTSTDGIVWAARTVPRSSIGGHAVAFGGLGMFVMVGEPVGGDALILSSLIMP